MEGGHSADEANAPERLRELPSRLLNLAAGHAQRQVSDRLATLDSRKWHYATLAALEEFGPDSQSGLSDRTGIHRSDLVATINELTARGLVVGGGEPGGPRPKTQNHKPTWATAAVTPLPSPTRAVAT